MWIININNVINKYFYFPLSCLFATKNGRFCKTAMVVNCYGRNEKFGSAIKESRKEYTYYVQLNFLKL
jgi:hypothetical protein